MNIKNRLKKLETVHRRKQTDDAKYGINFDEWRRLAFGTDITAEIPKSRRADFDIWQSRADERRREAAATMRLYAD